MLGRALLVGGSPGMAGAMVLATGAALRGGTGYVVTALCAEGASALCARYPAALQTALPDLRLHGAPAWLDALRAELQVCSAIGLGPGLGRSAEAAEFTWLLLDFLAETRPQLPIVVDADAIRHLAARRGGVSCSASLLLTPHQGEAEALHPHGRGLSRPELLQALVERTGATVILKGPGTQVGAPGHSAWRCTKGNPGMATAGSGDVLTGLLTALLARGMMPFDAARLAVELHGVAGDLAAAQLGGDAMQAADLIDFLAPAWQSVRGASRDSEGPSC